MRTLIHNVQIITDNTDVFGGTIIEEVPDWAKHLMILCGYSDYDSLIDIVIKRDEYMRQSAPIQHQADNLVSLTLEAPHIIVPVDRVGEFPVNVNWNVVTAGVGLCCAIYSST